MHAGVVTGRVASRWCSYWSGGCGRGGFDDLLRRLDLELGEQVALGLGELSGLPERARGAGEGAQGEQVELAGDPGPGNARGGLGDPDEQQGEPAQADVRPDPFLFPVAGRAQVNDLLEVAPAALDFQQLLVAQRDAPAESLGSELRSRYLPSRFSSALILAASVRSRPPGVTRRYRFRPGLVEMIRVGIFVREIPGGTRAGIGPAQLTCPNTDTDHSDQTVPVLFAPLFPEGAPAELHETLAFQVRNRVVRFGPGLQRLSGEHLGFSLGEWPPGRLGAGR